MKFEREPFKSHKYLTHTLRDMIYTKLELYDLLHLRTHKCFWNTPAWCSIGHNMMTSSNENIFCSTGPLCGEFTGHRWIPRTKASDAELWYFSLICAWINGWVTNPEAGDLRRHRAHYDVIAIRWSRIHLNDRVSCVVHTDSLRQSLWQ